MRRDPTVTELTHGQRQIWVGQQLTPDRPLYNMAFAVVLPLEIDAARFERAWRRVVDASDVLRTRVAAEAGAGVRLAETGGGATVYEDFSERTDPERAFRDWCRGRCREPLALDGELVDSVLVRLSAGRTGWYLNQHHLIADARSTILLYRQVAAAYAADGDGESPPTLPGYYPTVAALPASEAARETAAAHWEARREGRTAPFYGRSGRPGGTASTRFRLELDAARSRAIDELAGADGFLSLSPELSRFAVFAALLLGWLHRIGGEGDLGFDAPVAGRPTADAKRSLGLFIEMFPFRATVGPEDSLRALGARCLAEATLLLRHALPGTSAPSGATANNVVLNYTPGEFGDFDGARPEVEWIHPGHGDSVHALRLQVHDFSGSGRYQLHFDYNDAVLPEHLRRRGLEHFERLLDGVLADPDRPIARIDVLTESERRDLARLNSTARSPLPAETVVDMVRSRVADAPERAQLALGDRRVTRGELWKASADLAAALVRRGVAPGEPVAVFAGRSIETVVAVLGTLRAGAAWVPIDPAHPPSRNEAILADCGARFALVDGTSPPPTTAVDVAPLALADEIASGRELTLERAVPALDDLAYLIYTSGSTGRPKGVEVEHGGLADYLLWASRRYVRGERLTFPWFTSLSFDLTVTSFFLPLVTGGLLEIHPETEGGFDSALLDVLRADRADFIKLTPAHLSLLRQADLGGTRLRRMVVGGEDLKTALAAAVSARRGHRLEIHNEYGPTEAVVGCVAHRYRPEQDVDGSVPIGAPADHVEVRILNEAGAPVPEGVPGELWVTRFGLARGYHGLAERTGESFRPDPLGTDRVFYRTGDRVRLSRPDQLTFLGRFDRQLKVASFRVEPGEIESALLAHPGVEDCVVVLDRKPEPATPIRDQAAGTRAVRRCVRCGLPSDYPRVELDGGDVCDVCRSYESVAERFRGYFGDLDDLRRIFAESRRAHPTSPHDCLLLLSGGKDSTYALCRLVEMGLSVYCFTLDNGFISEEAKANMRRVTKHLGVPLEIATTPAMNAIFRDSLERFSNVCQGCFKTIYTLGMGRAHELGVPIIVTGLSRGQMFETRLTPDLLRDGRHGADEIDDAVLAARKVYHRVDDEVSRSLDVSLFRDDRIFEEVRFVDFYRYCDAGLEEVLAHLERAVPWARPSDTGRSTNCLINDVGIWVHQRERGFHNYALPYSWDVRLGHKRREEALAELDDDIDPDHVRRILDEIGYAPPASPSESVDDASFLTAFYVASDDIPEAELRAALEEKLPAPLVPRIYRRLEALPLTAAGKVDEAALLAIAPAGPARPVRPPEGPVERYLVEVWEEQLAAGPIDTEADFFALGGTSLRAMEVMIRLCRDFDVDLPLDTLMRHPTVRRLAGVVEERILADVAALGGHGPARDPAEPGAGPS